MKLARMPNDKATVRVCSIEDINVTHYNDIVLKLSQSVNQSEQV